MWFCWPVYYMYKIIRCLPPQTTRVVSARATYYRDVISSLHTLLVSYQRCLPFSLWRFLRALIWFAWKYVKILIQQLILVGCAYKYQNLNSSMHLNLLFLASMQIWKVFFISRTSSRPWLQRKSSMFGGGKNFVFVELQNRLYTKLQWNTFFLFFLGHHLLVLSFSFSFPLNFH